jgi:hypothetical protein
VRRDTHSEIKQLDADRIRHLLKKMPLGELHFRELLL